MGAWGEAVAKAAFVRTKYSVKTQPLGNRIPLVDMQVSRGKVTADIQVKATGQGGTRYKFDYLKMRLVVDFLRRQPTSYRYAFVVVNCREPLIHVFSRSYLEGAFERADARTPANELPGSVFLVYADSSPTLPMLNRERMEGIAICRACDTNGLGGWTGDLFED